MGMEFHLVLDQMQHIEADALTFIQIDYTMRYSSGSSQWRWDPRFALSDEIGNITTTPIPMSGAVAVNPSGSSTECGPAPYKHNNLAFTNLFFHDIHFFMDTTSFTMV